MTEVSTVCAEVITSLHWNYDSRQCYSNYTLRSYLCWAGVLYMSHMSHNSKHHKACEHAGTAVYERNYQPVPKNTTNTTNQNIITRRNKPELRRFLLRQQKKRRAIFRTIVKRAIYSFSSTVFRKQCITEPSLVGRYGE